MTAMRPIEEKCMAGLQDETVQFCTQHESNAGRIIPCVKALEKEITNLVLCV